MGMQGHCCRRLYSRRLPSPWPGEYLLRFAGQSLRGTRVVTASVAMKTMVSAVRVLRTPLVGPLYKGVCWLGSEVPPVM